MHTCTEWGAGLGRESNQQGRNQDHREVVHSGSGGEGERELGSKCGNSLSTALFGHTHGSLLRELNEDGVYCTVEDDVT